MEQYSEYPPWTEQDRQLVISATQAAVGQAQLPSPEDMVLFPPNQLWAQTAKVEEGEIVLYTYLNLLHTSSAISTPLVKVAAAYLQEIRCLLSSEKTRERLGVEANVDVEARIFEVLVDLMHVFIVHLPAVHYQASYDVINESVVGYLKKKVDYDVRASLEADPRAKKSTIVPNKSVTDLASLYPNGQSLFLTNLKQINGKFAMHRKIMLGNRSAALDDSHGMQDALAHYNYLQDNYKAAKGQLKSVYKDLRKSRKNLNNDAWAKHRRVFISQNFPSIAFVDEIEFESPSTLAYRQVAQYYDHAEEYMMKLIRRARSESRAMSSF